MDQFGVSRKSNRRVPRIERNIREAVGPKHKAISRPEEAELPNFRRLNEKRQAEWRRRHGGCT